VTAGPGTTFSVLTLNLRFGLAEDGRHAWNHRREALRGFLADHVSDFMTFQEANDFQVDFLSACLPQHDNIGRRHPAPHFWQNNVIFFRAPWQLDRWEHFYLSPTPDIPSRFRESRWPRQCTLARFTNGPHHLVCGTTHLDFEEGVQVASAGIILQRAGRMAADRPVILTGDFNCTPISPCHAAFTLKKGTPAEPPPAFCNVLEPSFPGTFHGFKGGPGSRCIDWILYRGAIIKDSAGVIPFPPAPVYPSDHYPVSARFSWQKGDQAVLPLPG
jgi:endonuclease/exonuclease/phosphatase family metal-dependent hydrolase